MAIKNVVFDFGGVIVELDTQRPIDRFKEIGVADADKLLDPYEQKGLFLEFEQGKVDLDTFRRRLSEHAGKDLSIDDIYYGWMGFMRDVMSRIAVCTARPFVIPGIWLGVRRPSMCSVPMRMSRDWCLYS